MFKGLRHIFLILVSLLLANTYAKSQEVQWASSVLRFSSQYDKKEYSAAQVLGKPNKLPDIGASPCAWAPAKEESTVNEYVWVKFDRAIHVRQIAIAENLNPGAIYRIYLYDNRNKQYLVYENKNIYPPMIPGRMFRHFIEQTPYPVESLKLILRTNQVPGMNQIDAIGVSDNDTPIEAIINEITYENYDGKPENLGITVNSRADDMLPIISPDGKTLFFARKQHPENIGEDKADDIWVSHLDAFNKWTKPFNIGPPLNNQYHNYVASVTPDGNTLVLANEYTRFSVPSEGVSISRRTSTGWGKPENLRIKGMYNLNEFSCYHMGVNGQVILMAIERHDTYGDMDIYVSLKETGNNWTEPLNLGKMINSAGTEGSAFLAADGRTVYFSSDGRSGYGSFDMYMTRRLDDTWLNWTEPVNLGPKINTPRRDFYYTVPASGDYAYFSSDNNSLGGADLFKIKLPKEIQPEPVALVKGKIIDAYTNLPIEADIKYNDSKTGLEVGEAISGIENGEFQVVLPKGENYDITAQVPGYYPANEQMTIEVEIGEENYLDFDENDLKEQVKRELKEELRKEMELEIEQKLVDQIKLELKDEMREEVKEELRKQLEIEIREKLREKLEADVRKELEEELREEIQHELEEEWKKEIEMKLEEKPEQEYVELEKDIKMIPIKEGQIIRINKIYFEANKSFLREESHAELNRLVEFLNTNPSIYIEVGGHTNGLPSHEFCNELSNDRAGNVAKYLISKGILAERITFKGYGKTQPIADNSSLSGRKKNQRVEIKIMRVE